MSIQEDDFDIGVEHLRLKSAGNGVGAIVTFTGLVREFESITGDVLLTSPNDFKGALDFLTRLQN